MMTGVVRMRINQNTMPSAKKISGIGEGVRSALSRWRMSIRPNPASRSVMATTT